MRSALKRRTAVERNSTKKVKILPNMNTVSLYTTKAVLGVLIYRERMNRLLERFSNAFTANVSLKFPVYQKLVKFIWFQLIFCLLATAMEQVLNTENLARIR